MKDMSMLYVMNSSGSLGFTATPVKYVMWPRSLLTTWPLCVLQRAALTTPVSQYMEEHAAIACNNVRTIRLHQCALAPSVLTTSLKLNFQLLRVHVPHIDQILHA
jgi:hypothetical protein